MHADTVISTPTLPNTAQQTGLAAPYKVTQVRQAAAITMTQAPGPVSESTVHLTPQSAKAKMSAAEQSAHQATNEPNPVQKAEVTPLQAPRYIPLKTVLERAGGFSKSAWHDWSNPASPRYDPTIPRSVCLSVTGRGCVRWVEAEVDAWLAAKAVAGRKQYAAPGTKTVAGRKKGSTNSKVKAAQCTESASVVAKLVDA